LRVESAQRNGVWVVTRIEIEDRRLPDREQAEVEGLVTAFTSTMQFQVNGVAVDARNATFEGPAVALGLRAKVKGASASGVLLASSVRVRASDVSGDEEFDLRDAIGTVNAAAQTFVLRGVTVYYGSPQLEIKGGTVADIAPGRRVRVKGVLDSDGQRVVARKIEFESN
jgi:Domain of unknown function (DUF5666)